MTRTGHGPAGREPRRLEVERWRPPHSRGVLERLLGALRVYQPGSFSAARATLEAVRGEGPCANSPTIRELTGRLHEQLEELAPVLRERSRAGPRRRDLRALRQAEYLLRVGEALTMTQARRHLDDLVDVTQDVLRCLAVNAVPVDSSAREGRAPPGGTCTQLTAEAIRPAAAVS
ncbi:DUF6415 family natural product biosynthesis protein [Streptomyces sp. NPDC002490]|uniref:DUF6415 family natural product biosynthesis protein n=1 Tax=Streptomyces sp. NPDC002490 TaxID=3154416 RepID=UPI003331F901